MGQVTEDRATEWPKISVVTPSYNQGSFLAETIDSVLSQDYPNLEYVIIDGGSKDQSVEVIRRYASKLAYWVSEPDRGQAHALNKGFQRCTGEIFAWLNADDVYEPGFLREAARLLRERPDLDVLSGQCTLWYGDAQDRLMPPSPLRTYEDFLRVGSNWLSERLILQPESIFRRRAYDAAEGIPEEIHYAMDVALWMRMARAGCTFDSVPRPWARLRIHRHQKTADPFVAYGELCRVAWDYLRRDWEMFGERALDVADDIFRGQAKIASHYREQAALYGGSTSYRLGRLVTRWRFW